MKGPPNQVKSLNSDLAASSGPKLRRAKPLKGQAILEYTLLTVFVVLIFTYAFGVIRRSVFNLWVCQLYPRIASISGCPNNSTEGCWTEIVDAGGNRLTQCSR